MQTDNPPDDPAQGASSEAALRERELRLKERELEHRIRADRIASRRTVSPVATAVIAGVLSLVATGVTATASGWSSRSVEKEKFNREIALRTRDQQFQIILKATENQNPRDAARNLLFFVDIGYLADSAGRIRALARTGNVPVLLSDGRPVNDVEALAAAVPTISGADPAGYTVRDHVTYDSAGRVLRVRSSPAVSPMTEARFIVVHATVSRDLEGTLRWFADGRVNASAHYLVGRDGTVVQMARTDLGTWHVGQSEWKGTTGLNRYSIGIELVNQGRLRREGGVWIAGTGDPIPAAEVMEVRDPATGAVTGWHRYTAAQVRRVEQLSRALMRAYPSIREILGHEQVSPRKIGDPGPAFPLAQVRAGVRP